MLHWTVKRVGNGGGPAPLYYNTQAKVARFMALMLVLVSGINLAILLLPTVADMRVVCVPLHLQAGATGLFILSLLYAIPLAAYLVSVSFQSFFSDLEVLRILRLLLTVLGLAVLYLSASVYLFYRLVRLQQECEERMFYLLGTIGLSSLGALVVMMTGIYVLVGAVSSTLRQRPLLGALS